MSACVCGCKYAKINLYDNIIFMIILIYKFVKDIHNFANITFFPTYLTIHQTSLMANDDILTMLLRLTLFLGITVPTLFRYFH